MAPSCKLELARFSAWLRIQDGAECGNELRIECENKPKLRTFITFKNYQQLPAYVGKPLSFVERKTVSKLRLGILPIRLETARYMRPVLPEDQRLCYCNDGNIENEYHVMFVCSKYHQLRQAWLSKISCPDLLSLLTPSDKFKWTLNEPNNVRFTAQYLVAVSEGFDDGSVEVGAKLGMG